MPFRLRFEDPTLGRRQLLQAYMDLDADAHAHGAAGPCALAVDTGMPAGADEVMREYLMAARDRLSRRVD